jgi:LmbE family N-acetylglucosaminyl deacetylase
MKLRWLAFSLLVLVLLAPTHAGNRNTYPLPEERGTAGILGTLEKLTVYVRVLHTTAHPDDESAGTLTWLSRKAHARTALFSLTRGDGGQNILGNEQYEALGLVRTGELLEACRIYGVELYFSAAYEFGFSKSAEETLSKWGHEATLEEMVRFIRTWRPKIIISRFQGNSNDGHGHHQAAGIISREAFRAAGDPQKFPEHFKLGLRPWQAKKLYISARGNGGSSAGTSGIDNSRSAADRTVRIPVGDYDPVLGRSYREIGTEGYSKHRSQGNGANYSLPERVYDYYRLLDSTVGSKTREEGFFDSIDTSLLAIAELAGEEKASIAFLQEDLTAAQKSAAEALERFQPGHPAASAESAVKGAATLAESIRKVEASSISAGTKKIVEDALREKLEDFQNAVNATLGIYLVAQAQDVTAVPGQKEPVTVFFYNRGTEEIDLKRVMLWIPEGWNSSLPADLPPGKIAAGNSAVFRFSVDISPGAKVTEPFWYRENKENTRYKTRPTENVFAPFGKPEVTAQATYRFRETEIALLEPARAQAGDPLRGSDIVELQIVPSLSVTLTPGFGIAPLSPGPQIRQFQVSVLNNDKAGAKGTFKLIVPSGWQVEPAEAQLAQSRKGEAATAKFKVHIPASTRAGTYPIEAVALARGREFRRGYEVTSYPENWTRNLYTPSHSDLEIFDVKIAPDLTVGYVMGSGDEVPASLEQLDVKVQMLSGADLAFGDLSRFSAIVTGVRAYNVNDDLRANNQRLLQYVERGGTLIVQYNRLLGRGGEAPFPYGPYPMSNADADRITVEEAPVRILDLKSPIYNMPNRITEADFQGWVQERGTYFMRSWDPRYTALLSGNDPGESPKDGGMLVARYGKGYYIYTAFAWFRQLPAGVPGAFRIFANMLSLGKR